MAVYTVCWRDEFPINHKRFSIIRKAILLLLALLILYVAINAQLIWTYAGVDEKRPTDVAIVLGAGTSGTEPSPVFKERLNHGIWLYQNGYVKKLILTGGFEEGSQFSDSYIAMRYVESMGVPRENILYEEKSTITQENIKYAKQIMDEKGFRTAILVSDPLHMKRAMRMAGDAGIEAFSSPTPTSKYISLPNRVKFLIREVFFYIGYQWYRLLPWL